MAPATASNNVSRSSMSEDVARRRAQRFQNSDFARALQHGRVHREKHHQKSDDHGDADHHVRKVLEDRECCPRSGATSSPPSSKPCSPSSMSFQLRLHRGSIGGIVDLDLDHADLSRRAEVLSCSVSRSRRTCATACRIRRCPYMPLHALRDRCRRRARVPGARVDFVDERCRPDLERPAFEIAKAAAHRVELVEIDSGDGIEVGQRSAPDSGGQRHVRLLADESTIFCGMVGPDMLRMELSGGRTRISAPVPRERSAMSPSMPRLTPTSVRIIVT